MGQIELNILIRHAGWKRVRGLKGRLACSADALFARLPKSLQKPLRATVLLTGNREVQKLNERFRGIPRPTNVLSFPSLDRSKKRRSERSGDSPSDGDIVLAYQYIVGEARTDHKLLIPHTCHLLVHGILHILGYDHGTRTEARRMEGLEARILADLGFPDPYEQEPKE